MWVLKVVTVLTSNKLKWVCLGGGSLLTLLFMLWHITGPPRTEIVLSCPFDVSSILKNNLQDVPTEVVDFQVLDQQNELVSNGLIKFEWTEGGSLSFQTNLDGVLTMKFEKDFLDQVVMVSTEAENGKIRVTW